MSEHKEPIPSMIYNAAVGGHVTTSQQIIDEVLNKEQSVLNAEQQELNKGILEEKEYTSGSNNGMGRVVLRKNLVEGVNTLVQTMINKSNTIYVVQYDFTLGTNITIPANCILEFDGGSMSGAYTLTGNNTKIQANKKIFDNNIIFAGTWNCSQIESYWWDIREDDSTYDNAPSLQKGIDLAALNDGGLFHISGGKLYVDITKVDKTDTNWSTKYGTLQMKSGVHVVIDSGTTIKAMDNTEIAYSIFMCFNIENASIEGGNLKGDVDTNASAKSGEWGYGIAIFSANNITVKNVNLSYFNGDGIMIGRTYDMTTYPSDRTNFTMIPHNIFISGCDISCNGRQGISVCGVISGVISDCFIHEIGNGGYGTPPKMAIDVEPNPSLADEKVDGLLIDNIKTRHNSTGSITIMGENSASFPAVHNIRITNCDCMGRENIGLRLYNAADTKVSNCLFEAIWIEDTYDKGGEAYAPTIITNCYTCYILIKAGANSIDIVNTHVYGDMWDSCVAFEGNNSFISFMNCAFYQMDTMQILRYVDEDAEHNAMTYDNILYLNCSFGYAYNGTIDSTHATYVNNAVGIVRRLR